MRIAPRLLGRSSSLVVLARASTTTRRRPPFLRLTRPQSSSSHSDPRHPRRPSTPFVCSLAVTSSRIVRASSSRALRSRSGPARRLVSWCRCGRRELRIRDRHADEEGVPFGVCRVSGLARGFAIGGRDGGHGREQSRLRSGPRRPHDDALDRRGERPRIARCGRGRQSMGAAGARRAWQQARLRSRLDHADQRRGGCAKSSRLAVATNNAAGQRRIAAALVVRVEHATRPSRSFTVVSNTFRRRR